MRLFVATMSALALTTIATAAVHAETVTHTKPHEAAVASPTLADERCLLEMVALSNSGGDQNSKGLGQAGLIFFTGRLAHDPAFDFGRLKALIRTLDIKEAQADLQQRCVPAFEKSMQDVRAALAPPQAAAQPPAPPQPAAPAGPPAAPPVTELPH